MNRSMEIEVKVGIFVTIGIALTLFTILILGGGSSIFSSNIEYRTKFKQVEGLIEGATVKVSGVRVGQVEKIHFMKDSSLIEITMSVQNKYKDAIHQNATVGVQTQGMLGDRYVVINPGTSASPIAAPGAELQSEEPRDLKDYLNSADDVIARLKNSLKYLESILGSFQHDGRADVFFKNMSNLTTNLNSATQNMPSKMKDLYGTLEHLRSIAAKIDEGQGTVGALINDPSLYDEIKTLIGGANRNKVLKYFIKKSVDDSKEATKKEGEGRH